jgi:hypothetical protein
VVDFPEPTLQVTSNNPFFLLINSKSLFGNHKSSKLGTSTFIGLNTAQTPFFETKIFTLNLENHFNSIEKSNSILSLNSSFCLAHIIASISSFKADEVKTS